MAGRISAKVEHPRVTVRRTTVPNLRMLIFRLASDPLLYLFAAVSIAIVLLATPIRLPIGALYWDLYFTVDGAYRVAQGQTPHVDFFAPSGPLPFYVLAATQAIFAQAHPLLAAQYGYMLITAPLMAAIALDVQKRSRGQALALVLPFCFLCLAPINGIEFFDSPGFDGVGLYNRQSGVALYVLLAALFMMGAGPRRNVVSAVALAVLFYSKINVALPALVLIAYVAAVGFLTLRSAGVIVAGAALLVVSTGLVLGLLPAYLADIAALSAHNAERIGSRLATVVSVKFDVILALILLTLVLLLADLHRLARLAHASLPSSWLERLIVLRSVLRSHGVLLGVCVVMAVTIEMQNTGSQEFAFLWPVLLMIGAALAADYQKKKPGVGATVALVLMAACVLPTALTLVKRTARAVAIAPLSVAVDLPILRGLNSVLARSKHLATATALQAHYASYREAYASLASHGAMPSTTLYSDPSFQLGILLANAEAARALLALEAREQTRLRVIYTASNVDILPYALEREPLKGVTVSLDLHRGFPASRQPRLVSALAGADAILLPRCPMTPYKRDVEALIEPALVGRTRVPLTPCFDVALKS